MKTLPWLLALSAVALPAQAQTLHKCTVDGKVSYSHQPCDRGQAAVIAVPEAPAPDPTAAKELQRQRKEADKLESARHKREARQEREDIAAGRVAAARARKCDKLRLQQKWAEEDARGATIQGLERARTRASRANDLYKLECGS